MRMKPIFPISTFVDWVEDDLDPFLPRCAVVEAESLGSRGLFRPGVVDRLVVVSFLILIL